jgi:hypothetical protein
MLPDHRMATTTLVGGLPGAGSELKIGGKDVLVEDQIDKAE